MRRDEPSKRCICLGKHTHISQVKRTSHLPSRVYQAIKQTQRATNAPTGTPPPGGNTPVASAIPHDVCLKHTCCISYSPLWVSDHLKGMFCSLPLMWVWGRLPRLELRLKLHGEWNVIGRMKRDRIKSISSLLCLMEVGSSPILWRALLHTRRQ